MSCMPGLEQDGAGCLLSSARGVEQAGDRPALTTAICREHLHPGPEHQGSGQHGRSSEKHRAAKMETKNNS